VKKLVLAGLVALGLAFATAFSVGAHADEPLSCADALTAFQDASKAATAAKTADQAAADAKKADNDLADAQAAVADARAAAVTAGVASENLTATFAATLRTERATILAKPVADRTDTEIARLAVIDKQLPLVEAYLAAQVRLGTATTAANATDADALRREADKTDTDALTKSADKARDVATDACKGDTTVVITPPPAAVPVPTRIDTGRA
jgi:hypothetical protein